jgi:alpha-ketoglutarate-dependent taurine dioxygenase
MRPSSVEEHTVEPRERVMEAGQLSPGLGAVIDRGAERSVLEIDATRITSLLRQRGAVLFRGFDVSEQEFGELTRRFSRAMVRHGAGHRPNVGDDKYLHLADPGTSAAEFHAELAYFVTQPELIWFHCVTPAAQGGETTLCDGTELFSRLGELARPFLERRLRYTALWSPSVWQRYFDTTDPAEVTRRLAARTDVQHAFLGSRLELGYFAWATRMARYSGAPAFTNALLPYAADLPDFISFEDGAPIPRGLVARVRERANEIAVPVKWSKGDLIMIDNSRVMHGRNAFTDPARKLHVRMSDASF